MLFSLWSIIHLKLWNEVLQTWGIIGCRFWSKEISDSSNWLIHYSLMGPELLPLWNWFWIGREASRGMHKPDTNSRTANVYSSPSQCLCYKINHVSVTFLVSLLLSKHFNQLSKQYLLVFQLAFTCKICCKDGGLNSLCQNISCSWEHTS